MRSEPDEARLEAEGTREKGRQGLTQSSSQTTEHDGAGLWGTRPPPSKTSSGSRTPSSAAARHRRSWTRASSSARPRLRRVRRSALWCRSVGGDGLKFVRQSAIREYFQRPLQGFADFDSGCVSNSTAAPRSSDARDLPKNNEEGGMYRLCRGGVRELRRPIIDMLS